MDEMRKAFEARFPNIGGFAWDGKTYHLQAGQNDQGVAILCLQYRASWEAWQAATMAERERAELEGYVNGLTTAGNLKPRVPRGDEGTLVLNDIRAQIDEKLANAIRGE